MTSQRNINLSTYALDVLSTSDAHEKAHKTKGYFDLWHATPLTNKTISTVNKMPDRPARPDKPTLLLPKEMPKRDRGNHNQKKISLLHALSHIELNAIDLAWDIIGRFAFYYDG